jgi:hypothetical protein
MMRVVRGISVMAMALATMAPSVGARTEAAQSPRAELLSTAVNCLSVPEASERLACLEKAVRALGDAESERRIVVVDEPQAEAARRAAFGLPSAPAVKLPEAKAQEKDIDELAGAIQTASLNGFSKWAFTLEDGSRWQQVDDSDLGRTPKAGSPVLIKRTPFGTYQMKVDNQRWMKVRRER